MVDTLPDRHRAKCPLVSKMRAPGGGGHPVTLTVMDPVPALVSGLPCDPLGESLVKFDLFRALECSQVINDCTDILRCYRSPVIVDHLVNFRHPGLLR
jgi:hypothetical protein